MNTKIRIAQIRVVPEKGNLKTNHEKLMSILDEVARETVDVVVTPEGFLDGYVAMEASVRLEQLREYAIDPSESVYVSSVSKWAGAASAWLIFGCSRISPAGVYNTALIFDRKGVMKGSYDKIHCQTHDKKYLPGQTLPVFDSDFGPFGIMICADRRWPETVRSLALQGARLIFNPTYGMYDERNMHMMQTRSYESEVFIAFTHPRQSLLTDPTGRILCNDTREDVHYSVSEIDLSEVDAVRTGNSAHLRDRRPDIYMTG
ncbi:MAG: carbon-nitrogen hydrolase family protein [Phycisphaerae bacterium]